MKWAFYLGLLSVLAFEVANVYFIMPLPGSQAADHVELAYGLYSWRWLARGIGAALMVAGGRAALGAPGLRRAPAALGLLLVGLVVWQANFKMAADTIFSPPGSLVMASAAENTVALDRLVVGVEIEGDARAYPIQWIGYHHLVADTVGGAPVLVSYCTVCRTGRVFSPVVEGVVESWRLVGMDQFNAMIEDGSTGSWWRQANGEAVAGPRKGARLTTLPSQQMTLGQWLALYPRSKIMQADPGSLSKYSDNYAYEDGSSTSRLTGTDPGSWADKSWVVGISHNGESRAYDWNRLRSERLIHDVLGGAPLVLVMAEDHKSFFALQRASAAQIFALREGALVAGEEQWALNGVGPSGRLAPIQVSQEFWHSWRTFHPETTKYEPRAEGKSDDGYRLGK